MQTASGGVRDSESRQELPARPRKSQVLVCGDARRLPLRDGTVQCVVTSPPYWGLRKYAGAQEVIWRKDLTAEDAEGCAHRWVEERWYTENCAAVDSREAFSDPGVQNATRLKGGRWREAGTCELCGAWRGAYGLEPTVEMYVAHTVEVLREIRRVLRDDGVCFWNVGDSYARAEGKGQHKPGQPGKQNYIIESGGGRTASGMEFSKSKRMEHGGGRYGGGNNSNPTLKPKDLCLIPQRVALAAQGFAVVSAREIARMADALGTARMAGDWSAVEMVEGVLRTWATWAVLDAEHWVRSVIIWDKPNPMPESVTDRPTDAYEQILMLTKAARYFWDAEAVKEQQSQGTFDRYGKNPKIPPKRKWSENSERGGESNTNMQEHIEARDGEMVAILPAGRNLRNVWTFPTQPYSGAHFATFPEELPRRCILAATSAKGACRFCGAPWWRVVQKATEAQSPQSWKDSTFDEGKIAEHQGQRMQRRTVTVPHDGETATAYEKGSNAHRIALLRQAARERGGEYVNELRTIGWRPTCECRGQNGKTVPCLVLDPFGGSGTTGRVAVELNRRAVLLDLAYAHDYGPLARKRTSAVQRRLLQ